MLTLYMATLLNSLLYYILFVFIDSLGFFIRTIFLSKLYAMHLFLLFLELNATSDMMLNKNDRVNLLALLLIDLVGLKTSTINYNTSSTNAYSGPKNSASFDFCSSLCFVPLVSWRDNERESRGDKRYFPQLLAIWHVCRSIFVSVSSFWR